MYLCRQTQKPPIIAKDRTEKMEVKFLIENGY